MAESPALKPGIKARSLIVDKEAYLSEGHRGPRTHSWVYDILKDGTELTNFALQGRLRGGTVTPEIVD